LRFFEIAKPLTTKEASKTEKHKDTKTHFHQDGPLYLLGNLQAGKSRKEF